MVVANPPMDEQGGLGKAIVKALTPGKKTIQEAKRVHKQITHNYDKLLNRDLNPEGLQ